MLKKLLFLTVLLTIGLTSFSQITFDGGTGGTGTDWSVAENWSSDVVPVITDDVEIDGYDVTITTATTAVAATVSILTGTLTMEGAATLTVGSPPPSSADSKDVDANDHKPIDK